MWATLSCDLLLQIFRRLGSTAVIRSAGVCRPWRRAIIENASCLRPRPDRFLPDLLLAFLDTYWPDGRRLRYAPAAWSSANVPALDGVDVSQYDHLLASRDGFLLHGGNTVTSTGLSLCNPITGSRRLIPAAVFGIKQPSYVLATGHDDDDADGAGGSAVRILATGEDKGMTYQIFSTSGAWGPVKRSRIMAQNHSLFTGPNKDVVVCGGSVVYWLVMVFPGGNGSSTSDTCCLFAMDMRTEQTWTTELPAEEDDLCRSVLATTEDGQRLTLVVSRHLLCQFKVWVLGGDDCRWTLQRTIDLQRLMLTNFRMTLTFSSVFGFCPRSGCLFGICVDDDERHRIHDFIVSIDGSSPRLIDRAKAGCTFMLLPYEMDWSTYISNMKSF